MALASHDQPCTLHCIRFWFAWFADYGAEALGDSVLTARTAQRFSEPFRTLPNLPDFNLLSSVERVVGTPSSVRTLLGHEEHWPQVFQALPAARGIAARWCTDGFIEHTYSWSPVVQRNACTLGGSRSAGGSCRCRQRDADKGLRQRTVAGGASCHESRHGRNLQEDAQRLSLKQFSDIPCQQAQGTGRDRRVQGDEVAELH